MKKRNASVAVFTAVAILLSGCSSAPSEGGDNTITFMGWGSDTEIAVFNDMIAQFEDQYPDVTVDYITVPAGDFQTRLQTMIASNNAPDVFYLAPENVMPFVDGGIIADLSEYIDESELFDPDNVWDNALDMYRYDGTTPGVGASYGLPKDIGPFALAYNKDLFDAAGITAPDPENPWTWEEFVAAATALTSGSGDDKVYGSAPYSLESAVWSNGADWLNSDYTEVTVTDPAFVEALQWVADLSLVEGVVPTSEEESSLPSFQRFMEGNVAMMGVGPWNQGGFWADADFAWDLMPWPVSPATGERAVWYGGIGYAVSEKSDDKEAASNLAAFLAFNEDAQRTNMEQGQAIPNLIDMTNEEYLPSDKLPENKQEFIRIIQDYGRRATQTYTYNSEWFGLFNSNLASVWTGEMTAAEYAESVAGEMQELLDQGIAEQAE
ncbi:ABC transporter substrate-binding protein [Microcella indica]|uniref:ABC transporter substrate-binding protein n=1 Tax=Microcella indica TaxID=2750620 RepID=UPI0015CF75B8|nr:sugar ABC transporter substrate-binding protein [Microcella indica]